MASPQRALAPFRVDLAAFDAWITMRGHTLAPDIPAKAADSRPAAALGELIEEAAALGPLVGDDRVDLQLIAADDEPASGYVLIVRPRGHPVSPGVTVGWVTLTLADPEAEPRDAAWTYLTAICDQANTLLADTRKVLP